MKTPSSQKKKTGNADNQVKISKACVCVIEAVVAAMAARGTSVVLSGFALPDDGYHSPDEHLRVSHLELGVNAAMGILEALALVASPGD
jgi:acetylornithine deacetylase/succinyl-diaminopimelate desuccinylase-like protein